MKGPRPRRVHVRVAYTCGIKQELHCCKVERPDHPGQIGKRRAFAAGGRKARLAGPSNAGQHEVLPGVQEVPEVKVAVHSNAQGAGLHPEKRFESLQKLRFAGEHSLGFASRGRGEAGELLAQET